MLDLSIRSVNHGFAASPDWLQSFALMVHRSDRTWSYHRLGIHCAGRVQGQFAAPAGKDSGLARVDGNRFVAAKAVARTSVASS
jgi:hypothetical protein